VLQPPVTSAKGGAFFLTPARRAPLHLPPRACQRIYDPMSSALTLEDLEAYLIVRLRYSGNYSTRALEGSADISAPSLLNARE
jgi:hypothetical protein